MNATTEMAGFACEQSRPFLARMNFGIYLQLWSTYLGEFRRFTLVLGPLTPGKVDDGTGTRKYQQKSARLRCNNRRESSANHRGCWNVQQWRHRGLCDQRTAGRRQVRHRLTEIDHREHGLWQNGRCRRKDLRRSTVYPAPRGRRSQSGNAVATQEDPSCVGPAARGVGTKDVWQPSVLASPNATAAPLCACMTPCLYSASQRLQSVEAYSTGAMQLIPEHTTIEATIHRALFFRRDLRVRCPASIKDSQSWKSFCRLHHQSLPIDGENGEFMVLWIPPYNTFVEPRPRREPSPSQASLHTPVLVLAYKLMLWPRNANPGRIFGRRAGRPAHHDRINSSQRRYSAAISIVKKAGCSSIGGFLKRPRTRRIRRWSEQNFSPLRQATSTSSLRSASRATSNSSRTVQRLPTPQMRAA